MRRIRRRLAGFAALAVVGAIALPTAMPAVAAPDDAVFTTFAKIVTPPDQSPYAAGEEFSYTIAVNCNSPIVDICIGAHVSDTLPPPLVFDPAAPNPVVVTGGGTPPATVTLGADGFDVTFNEEGTAGTGLRTGEQVNITVFVQVPADASADFDGDVTNTATAAADNALSKDASVTTQLDIPEVLDSTVSKSVDDHVADGQTVPALPGQPVDYVIGGGNASNRSVDAIVVQDPADGVASPFDGPLDFTGITSITPPAGADQVQVEYLDANGNWVVTYPTGPIPTDFTNIPDVPPDQVHGLRFTFSSSAGQLPPTPPGQEAAIGISSETNDQVLDIPLDTSQAIPNTASSNVVVDGRTNPPKTADGSVVISNTGPTVDVSKSFADPTLLAGETTTATIDATNGPRPVTSMTIEDPTPGQPDLADQGLVFGGFTAGVEWPAAANGVSVTYTYADGSTETLTGATPNQIPPPTGVESDVVGFSITFTGPIQPNAVAEVPFDVTADPVSGQLDVVGTNQATSTVTDAAGLTGTDADAADLTRQPARVSTTVDKNIAQSSVWDIPGTTTDVSFLATVNNQGPNASTVGADSLVVSDPADPQPGDPPSAFWNTFDAKQLSAGVPANANLTVQYWDGTQWVTFPGAELIEGPTTWNFTVPADLQDDVQGIRFVYTPKPGETLPPGFQVSPSFSVATRDQFRDGSGSVHDAALAANPLVVANDASSTVTNPADTSPGDNTATDSDAIDVDPWIPDGSGVDLIEKTWLQDEVFAFTDDERTARITWSTEGVPFDSVAITDDPTAGADFSNLAASAFDAWDLARIEPIDASLDPTIAYDRVAAVELYDDTADAWVDVTAAACGAADTTGTACDGGFPGYTLSDAERASTLAVRLTYVEGSNRGGGSGPAPGTGVAQSTGHTRGLDLEFRLRQVKRSDGGPVVGSLHGETYNSGLNGVVENTVGIDGVGPEPVSQQAVDDITILDTTVNVSVTKTFDQDALPIPPPTTPQDDYPLVSATITARNETEANIAQLAVSDPATPPAAATDTYDRFNLFAIGRISVPANATESIVTLTHEGGGTTDHTIAEAQALEPAQLADVIGVRVVHRDPTRVAILSTEQTSVVLVFQLREFLRSAPGTRPAQGDLVTNVASVDGTRPGGAPIDEAHGTDDDTLQFVPATYGVLAGKSISPPARYEDEPRTGYTVTIGGQPTGNVRTTVLTITDDEPTFWNAFEFTAFTQRTMPPNLDQIRVSALVGVDYALDGGTGELVQTCGGSADLTACWVVGDWQDVPASNTVTPALPAGVAPAAVRGIRIEVRRDAAESNWELPRNPIVSFAFTAARLENLRFGPNGETDSVPVPSTLPGLVTAPGEAVQGTTTDEVDVHGVGSWDTPVGGLWTADASAQDTTDLLHRVNAISVTKSPGNGQSGTASQQFPPDSEIPYVMTVTNTGQWQMTGLELSDTIGGDAQGSYLVPVPGADPVFEFDLTDAGGDTLPTTGFSGSLDTATGVVTITVPADFVFAPGDVLTITAHLQFRPALPPGTPVGNAITATSDRDFETCTHTSDNRPAPDVPSTASCTADTSVTPAPAAPVAVTKSVRGVGAGVPGAAAGDPDFDDLGVLSLSGDPDACATPNASADTYVNQCVPITRPGGVEEWRIEFTNRGNVPADVVGGIDVLPAVGDTGVVVGSQRGSQWAPVLLGIPGATVPPGVTLSYLTTVPNQACNATDLQFSVLIEPVPAGDPCAADVNSRQWIPFDGSTPAAELAAARAVKLVVEYPAGSGLDPGASGAVTFQTQTPAWIPDAYSTDLPVAWNTVAAGSRATFDAVEYYQGPVEPVRAGVAFPVGEIQLEKDVVTPPGWTFPLPDDYDVDVRCASLGEDVALVDGLGGPVSPVTVPAGGSALVGPGTNLPLYSDCTVAELASQGATATYDPAGTGGRSGPVTATTDLSARTDIHHPFDPAPIEDATITVENEYAIGGFDVTKAVVEGGALDQDGDPIAFDPTFTFTASCTFLDVEVVPVDDRTFTLQDGDTKEFAPLPAGAECTVTETDPAGATTTEVVVTEDGTAGTPSDDEASFTVLPDEPGGTHVTALAVTNTYTVGSLTIEKAVTGTGEDLWAPAEFTVHLTCTWDQATTNPVYDADLVVPADGSVTIDDLPTGADCVVTEPDDGGATGDPEISPASVEIGAAGEPGDPVTVTVTNDFRTGGFVVEKTVSGSGVGFSEDVDFTFHYECTYEGAPVGEDDLTITGDGTAGPFASETVTGLPVGTECVIAETANGGADATPVPATITIPDQATAGVEEVETAAFENRFTAGTVAVTKDVTGDAGDIPEIANATYTVHVTCALTDGGTPLFDDDVEVTGNSTVTVEDPATGLPLLLPVGTHCWGSETDDGGATDASVDFDSFDDAVIVTPIAGDQPQPVELTATNRFDDGDLVVEKDLAGNPAWGAGRTFEILVTCTFDPGPGNPPVVIYDRETVELQGGQQATLLDIPIGSECWAEEPDPEGAVDVDISATEEDPVVVGSATGITITVTNTYLDAGFSVDKTVDDGGAVDQDGDPIVYDTVFTFSAVCVFEGDTVLDTTFQLSDGQEQVFGDLPAGAECTVTETGTGGSTGTTMVITEDGAATDLGETTAAAFTLLPDAADGTHVTAIGVTNPFTVGSLQLTKAVSGTGADAWAGEFGDYQVHVVCSVAAADPDTVYDDTLTLTTDAPGNVVTIPNLPTGAECDIEETDLGGATEATVSGNPVVIGDDAVDGPVQITVDNEFRTGALNVLKEVRGPGVPEFSTGPFVFGVVCTYEGETVVSTELVVVGEEDSSGPYTSDTITGIPVGAECVVTEVDDGGADATAPPVTVTIPDQATDDVETVVTAGFLNRFSLGLLGAAKRVDGEAADAPWVQDAVFTLQVTCELDVNGVRVTVFDDTIGLAAGDIQPLRDANGDIVRLPVGTHCWGSEPDLGGATAGSLDHDSYDDAIVVETAGIPQVLLVTATNTFEYGQLELEKTISGSAESAAGKTFTVEVTCTLDRGEQNEPYVALDHEPVTITGGQSVELDQLPVGAECWAEETDTGGAISVAVSATEADPVVVGAETTVTITFDNEFAPPPPVTGVDGAALARFGGLGGLLVLLGVGLLALRRARRLGALR
ncbi:DUF5979 domain-containing protein [Agromyces sp. MMS24-JH15]|uniref:DUF5979 domain-containing protein n=1 Tax=Agromyces sp. MMS24-JH15 TaxID=3243765 RepID=UPI00374A03AC